MQDLVDSERTYNESLQAVLSEHQLYRQLLPSRPRRPSTVDSKEFLVLFVSFFYTIFLSISDVQIDPALVSWLEANGLSSAEVDLFTAEGYALSDVVDFFTREDLRRLGLRGGPELRLWRAILERRANPTDWRNF